MTLYTLNGSIPAELPFRIILANGASRTDPSTFTAAEIAEAGYVEAPNPPSYNEYTHQLGWDAAAKKWVVEELPPVPVTQPSATLYAAVAIGITDGSISVIEQAAQLSSATYEDGWVMIGFTEPQDTADYLIFAQTDVPAKIEQFKEPGYFELVFSDPGTGDPINPGRIDIQVLKVR